MQSHRDSSVRRFRSSPTPEADYWVRHALLRPAGLQSIRQIILRSSHFDGHEGTMKRRKNKAINRLVTSFVFRPSGVHICQLFSPHRRRRCCRRLESESRNAHDGGSYRAVDVMHRHYNFGGKTSQCGEKKVASGRCQSYRLRRSLEMHAISDKVNKRKNYEGHTSAND